MKIPFTASARTAMLIGMENFSNPEGAIIELVKNTYDADSPCCYILFDGNDGQLTEIYIKGTERSVYKALSPKIG